jgi:hypothetical protein
MVETNLNKFRTKSQRVPFLSLELWQIDNTWQPSINGKYVIKLQSKKTGLGGGVVIELDSFMKNMFEL